MVASNSLKLFRQVKSDIWRFEFISGHVLLKIHRPSERKKVSKSGQLGIDVCDSKGVAAICPTTADKQEVGGFCRQTADNWGKKGGQDRTPFRAGRHMEEDSNDYYGAGEK
jgi:hypothetical protein